MNHEAQWKVSLLQPKGLTYEALEPITSDSIAIFL